MDELDKKIKNILDKIASPASGVKKDDCPDDIVLSQFIDNALNEVDKEKMEQHLVECNNCLDQLIVHKKIREEEAVEGIPDVPQTIVKQAMNLVTDKKKDLTAGIVDVILTFAKETIEIMNPGSVSISYGAIPVPVRGEKSTLSANLITLKKTFSDIESEVDVERAGEGHVNIRTMIRNIESGVPVEKLRISLFNPHREMASYIAKNGKANFEGLKFGKYIIQILKRGKEIGQISLNIKE